MMKQGQKSVSLDSRRKLFPKDVEESSSKVNEGLCEVKQVAGKTIIQGEEKEPGKEDDNSTVHAGLDAIQQSLEKVDIHNVSTEPPTNELTSTANFVPIAQTTAIVKRWKRRVRDQRQEANSENNSNVGVAEVC
ncbi:hypothetical protein SESBI_46526 [Sesbania bispinosa]|nr:hypothetical protein SESBI_46526 [Sesbania bispinosa]